MRQIKTVNFHAFFDISPFVSSHFTTWKHVAGINNHTKKTGKVLVKVIKKLNEKIKKNFRLFCRSTVVSLWMTKVSQHPRCIQHIQHLGDPTRWLHSLSPCSHGSLVWLANLESGARCWSGISSNFYVRLCMREQESFVRPYSPTPNPPSEYICKISSNSIIYFSYNLLFFYLIHGSIWRIHRKSESVSRKYLKAISIADPMGIDFRSVSLTKKKNALLLQSKTISASNCKLGVFKSVLSNYSKIIINLMKCIFNLKTNVFTRKNGSSNACKKFI